MSKLVEIREKALELSGISVQELGQGLRKAHDTLVGAMSATRVENHTYQGKVVEQTEHIDHHVRLNACREYADIFGITPIRVNVPTPQVINRNLIMVSVSLGGGTDPVRVETTARVIEKEDIPSTGS